MTIRTRTDQQPAWLLHHRPFRDSSRILDVLTRDHGRLSVVARGARSGRSRLKGVLRPFLPLAISWVGRSDLGTLTGAEINGAPISLTGDGLLSGYYANELLLKLMHRHDPQPEIFTLYGRTIAALAGNPGPAPVLRQYEMELLGLLGYALNLDADASARAELVAERRYEYRATQGAVPVDAPDGRMVFSGRELKGIRAREFSDPAMLRAAGRLLSGVIAYHLDGRELMSRKVLRDLRRRPAGRQDMEDESLD